MTQHFPLDYQDVVHEGFFDPIQELLGASLPSLRIEVSNSSTLTINAGVGNDQVTAALTNSTGTEAGFRWITSSINATLPGGLTNGIGSVYITASNNDFSGTTADPDAPTDYSFAMEIRASGTPSTDLWRKVGEVDVSGGSIVAFRAMGGPRPTSEFGLAATPDVASQPGLLVTGLSGQTGKLIEVKNSSGTTVHSVDNSGASSQAGGITTTSINGVTISGAGGKDTLNISNTSADTGITIGGDVEIYRAAANSIQTDDSVTIRRTSSSDTTLATKVTSDSQNRIAITAGGEIQVGSGSASPDIRIRRTGSSAVAVDTPSGGAASVSISGGLTVGTTLTLSQATTAGHIPISDGTGLMSFGQAGSASIANDAVTADKLRDDASTDSNRAVTTNHIRDDAVTADKLRDDASTDANRAVTTNHLRDSSVTTAKMASNAVTSAKIATDAVGSAQIADDAVTAAELRDDASTDSNRAVTTNHIRDNAVTSAKIAPQPIDTRTTSQTLAASDAWSFIQMSSSSTLTVTISSATAMAVGDRVDIVRAGTGEVNFIQGSGAVINRTPGLKLRAQWSSASVICTAANTYLLVGDLAA